MWKHTSIAFPLIIAAAMLAAATAQSPGLAPVGAMPPEAPGPYYPSAPAPALDCFPYLLNVSDCLTFVQNDSTMTKPDPGCCPELANLVDTQPVCLCQLLGNSGQAGITIDVKKALKLPTVCKVTTPPISLCAAIGYPVSIDDQSEAPAPSPGEAEAAFPPSPGGDAGSASSLAAARGFLIGLLPLFFTFFF